MKRRSRKRPKDSERPDRPKSAALGEAIRLLRGLRTQAEVANLAKVHPSTWSLYEAGRRMPSKRSLDKILPALGVTGSVFERTYWRIQRSNPNQRADFLHLFEGAEDDPLKTDLRALISDLAGPLERLLLWLRQPE